jgi:probable HAF family extracellular repeat protein
MNRQSPLLAIVRKSALGALLGLSLTSHSLLGQISTITELKTLGGTAITAKALNNAGQVTGYSRIVGDAEQHAFFYCRWTLDIGALGGPFSQGNAINNASQVTGLSWTSSFQTRFLYSNGIMSISTRWAVRSALPLRLITQDNWSDNPIPATTAHAFRYAAGQMEDLGIPVRTAPRPFAAQLQPGNGRLFDGQFSNAPFLQCRRDDRSGNTRRQL